MFERTTQRAAELILSKRRPGRVKVTAGIQIRIAQKFKCVAVEGIASRLGDHGDHAAVIIPILRIEITGEHAKLFNRIEVRDNRRAAIHMFLHINAVHQKPVRRFSLPRNR